MTKARQLDELTHLNQIATGGTDMPQQIEHLVVLMLENRSFDHMLGFTREAGYDVDGLTGNESNPLDPNVAHSPSVPVHRGADPVLGIDPGHQVPDVNVQLFGRAIGPPPVNGVMNQG